MPSVLHTWSTSSSKAKTHGRVVQDDVRNAFPVQMSNRQPNKRPRLESSVEFFQEIIDLDSDEVDRSPEQGHLPFDMNGNVYIDLTNYEEALEAQANRQFTFAEQEAPEILPRRNVPLGPDFVIIDVYKWQSIDLRAGKTVELVDGTFLLIKSISQHRQVNSIVKLRGHRVIRIHGSNLLHGKLPSRLNELAFIYDLDRDDERDVYKQNIHEVFMIEVKRVRKLYCTNRLFQAEDELRFQSVSRMDFASLKEKKQWVRDHEVLVSRWVLIREYDNAYMRFLDNSRHQTYKTCRRYVLRPLLQTECTPGYFEPSSVQRLNFRGETIFGGSAKKVIPEFEEINPDQFHGRFQNMHLDDLETIYTVADACRSHLSHFCLTSTNTNTVCGAGGASGGAVKAGLRPVLAFDCWDIACTTFKGMFPDVDLHQLTVDQFIALNDHHDFKTDILHLSTPCVTFSPMNPKANPEEDYDKHDTILCAGDLLKKIKPRMVTCEQTFGLMHNKWRLQLNKFISQFTDHGYAISWQVPELQRLGLPQKRTRLIMVASG
jgi:DNA (cytosine-5)-methyltransferase 1